MIFENGGNGMIENNPHLIWEASTCNPMYTQPTLTSMYKDVPFIWCPSMHRSLHHLQLSCLPPLQLYDA